MNIKQLITDHQQAFTDKYGTRLLPSHRKALDAMLACRSQCGEYHVHCEHCDRGDSFPLSCGHRSCPQCQHHLAYSWLERQQQKLLPVEYFMVTFTLPQQLRTLARTHQAIIYELLFKASVEAVKTIGQNNYGVELAMTGVLHTHKRDKGYHPHLHLVVPGGGVIRNKSAVTWKQLGDKFLVNEFALATVFRGIFLRLLFEQALDLPEGLPTQWVANIRAVGRGEKALHYLSRYLYRGVISENDIMTDDNGKVTYRYRESKTNCIRTLSLPPADFLWRILQHVLPRGFRRVRDYGFLHANAKTLLQRIQLILRVKLNVDIPAAVMACKECSHPLKIIGVYPERIPIRFQFPRFYLVPGVEKPPG